LNVEGPRIFKPPASRSDGVWWLLRSVFTPPRGKLPPDLTELVHQLDGAKGLARRSSPARVAVGARTDAVSERRVQCT
jgi:hypothetical protein